MFDWEINLPFLGYRRMPLPHFPYSQLLVCNLRLQMYKQCSPFSYVLLEHLFFSKDYSDCLLDQLLLLSLRYLLEIILSVWERKRISLFPHLATKRLLTSFALLLRLSILWKIPDTLTEFPSVINDITNSIIDFAIWLDVFPLRKSFGSRYSRMDQVKFVEDSL